MGQANKGTQPYLERHGCCIDSSCNMVGNTMSIDTQEKLEAWSKVLITIGTWVIIVEIAAANSWFGLV